MNNEKQDSGELNAAVIEGSVYSEVHLRGEALGGSEQKAAVDHTEYEESREPDSELRLDGEDDNLYNDGLDVGGETESLAGTDDGNLTGAKG